jgi:S-DNA-T family DNA segregation ATPase FtsK/SpoIIIE
MGKLSEKKSFTGYEGYKLPPVDLIKEISEKDIVENEGKELSGRSDWIHKTILSILFKYKPDEVKLFLIDTKGNELSIYENIPHLIMPVVNDHRKGALGVIWCVFEMEERFHRFNEYEVKDIEEYNKKAAINNGYIDNAKDHIRKLPYMIVIIDDFSDLAMSGTKNVEIAVEQLSQKGKAAGIHIIMSMHETDSEFLKSLIKSNMSCNFEGSIVSLDEAKKVVQFIKDQFETI